MTATLDDVTSKKAEPTAEAEAACGPPPIQLEKVEADQHRPGITRLGRP